MRAVVQRVSSASVTIDNKLYSSINQGLLILLGIKASDNFETFKWFANKIINLRVFPDKDDKMNLSILDINASLLIVPNFTIYGNVQKGFRPSFSKAASPDEAEEIYDNFITFIKNEYSVKIETGVFGAMMEVEFCNTGPVTLIIDKE